MEIRIVTLSYNTQGKGSGGASGPEAILRAGLAQKLEDQGHTVLPPQAVQLTPEEESQYGGWNRVALANGHLSRLVADSRNQGAFILGLLADCNGCLGMLGGLQRSSVVKQPLREATGAMPGGETAVRVGTKTIARVGSKATARIGLVYVDAHGDYNTPDTSPSGMLGGMPAAVAAGKCLPRLRGRSGMERPINYGDILMAGMRDLDPLEKESMTQDGLTVVREADLIQRSPSLQSAMSMLSRNTDTIYVHVDLDILDPNIAPAAGLPSPGGLTGGQLGHALRGMLECEKVGALSLVSYRADQDEGGQTLKEVLDGILTGLKGL